MGESLTPYLRESELNPLKPYFSHKEVAESLGISESELEILCRGNKIKRATSPEGARRYFRRSINRIKEVLKRDSDRQRKKVFVALVLRRVEACRSQINKLSQKHIKATEAYNKAINEKVALIEQLLKEI